MTKICINGNFLCRNITGIERFAYEITTRLDKLVLPNQVEIYIPKNTVNIPQLENIKVVVSEKPVKSFLLWEQIVWARYLHKTGATGLSFGNNTTFLTPGIVFIHDIHAKLYPKDYSGCKQKLLRAYMCLMYHYAVHHAKKLITVSEFSKKQIAETYKIDAEKISVIPNGWEHFQSVLPDENIFEKFPALKKYDKEFYFTLGSLQKRKNIAWITKYASTHPTDFFVISGSAISGFNASVPSNVLILGRVTDGEAKALMQRCKAFLFPSYFEGFGIPPLEALSCMIERECVWGGGGKIAVAQAASLPEIYGDTVHYIDPFDTKVDLDKLLAEPVASAEKVLEKYNYEKSAKMLLEELYNFLPYSCTKK